jgi:hypothetical protein
LDRCCRSPHFLGSPRSALADAERHRRLPDLRRSTCRCEAGTAACRQAPAARPQPPRNLALQHFPRARPPLRTPRDWTVVVQPAPAGSQHLCPWGDSAACRNGPQGQQKGIVRGRCDRGAGCYRETIESRTIRQRNRLHRANPVGQSPGASGEQ